MADPSDSSDVISRFMDLSQSSQKLTDEDYHNALMEEKDPDLAKLRQMACDLAKHTWRKNNGARSKIESAGFHQKICVEFTTQKCAGFFICHLFIHGIHVASKEGRKMKDSRQNAFEAALQKILMPYLRISASADHAKSLEASLTPFSSSPQGQSESPSGISEVVTTAQVLLLNKESNTKELKNRGKEYKPIDEFVLLEPKNPASHKNVDAIMRRSANMNEMLLEYEYFFETDHVRCILRLEDKVLADVVESSKTYARTAASTTAIQKLQESCWTIKTKSTGPVRNTISDANIVTREELRQGISEGVTKEFCQRVRQVVENYASSDTETSLAFTWDFIPKEQKAIRQEISRAKLRADVVMKNGKKYCCVWRPYSQLFSFLKSVGGETKQYRLIPPVQNIPLTATGDSGSSQLPPDGLCASPSTSLFSSGFTQNASPLINDTNQFSQQTVNNLFEEEMTGASDAIHFGVKQQPRHEQGWSSGSQQEHRMQERISLQGARPLATSVSHPQFAEDWPPPPASDNWPSHGSNAPEGWTFQEPSSSHHHQEKEAEPPQPPGGHGSGGNGKADGEDYCGVNELMSLESLRKIVLLEKVAINTDRQLLQDTAGFNRLLIKFKYEKPTFTAPSDPDYQIVCHVLLGNKVVASGESSGKASSIISACEAAVKKMRKYCWCIKMKQRRDDVDVVSRSEFCGGGPGNDSGSTFSDTQSQSLPTNPQGPGVNVVDKTFDKKKVSAFFEMLIRSGNTAGLIFKDEYSDQEVKYIQTICIKVNLHFNTFRKKYGRFYLLSRKWKADTLFKHLQKLGGESDDHKLVPPLGENGDTDEKPVVFKFMNTDATETKAPHDALSQNIKLEIKLEDAEQSTSLLESCVNVPRDTEEGSRVQESGIDGPRNFEQGKSSSPRNWDQLSNLQGHNSSNHRNSEQVSMPQKSHSSNPRNSEQVSMPQKSHSSSPRNSEQVSMPQKSHSSNPRNSEHKSNLRGPPSSNHRDIEQDSKEGGRVRPRNTDYNYQDSNRGERHSHRPRYTDDTYGGSSSSQGEGRRYRHRNTDDDYLDSGHRESHNYRQRNTDDNYHGSWGEGHSYRDRISDDDYHGSDSSRVESHTYRGRNTNDDYHGSAIRVESRSYRDRITDDDYPGSSWGESHSHRQRNTDDDYHGRWVEHHSYRDRNTGDDYHGSSRVESHSYRDRNTDDVYSGSNRVESHSYRGRNTDDVYSGSSRVESHHQRRRNNDYGSNRGGSDSYKRTQDTGHGSSYLEKRRYEELPMWKEDNSSPRKLRRGQPEGFMY